MDSRELLEKRCRKSIAVVLSMKEKEVDPHLPDDVQLKFRKLILDQFNELTNLSIDILNTIDQGNVVVNEMWLERMEQIREVLNGS